MAEYFGKSCKYLSGKWENEDIYEKGDLSFKNHTPLLVFCIHAKNRIDTEGNCGPAVCPLGLTQ